MPWMWDGDIRVILTMLQTINQQLYKLTQLMERNVSKVTDAINDLTTQVKANTDAEESATHLISELASMIGSNADDPTAVRELATRLKSSAEALGAAVTANTPHSEEPPVEEGA